ncbi:MAG: precorrin-2 C(20)-methyltransferase, partial [Phascolarctobacterium sp.]|nr:precorrin-2 C(20)-methyltransferase [Phascolarctobacterium sp.]
VVFITLGCPTVYATCIYVHKLVLKDGYEAELVAGVSSICAVAAKLNVSLCERAEPLIVLPGSYKESTKFLDGPGNKVLMKSASEIGRVKEELRERNLFKNAGMVERCGLPGEKVYYDMEEVDPESSYFSVIIVKEKELGE